MVVNTKVKNDLIVTVKKDNYAFSSQLIVKDSIKNTKPLPIKPIVADTIAIGQKYLLDNEKI